MGEGYTRTTSTLHFASIVAATTLKYRIAAGYSNGASQPTNNYCISKLFAINYIPHASDNIQYNVIAPSGSAQKAMLDSV